MSSNTIWAVTYVSVCDDTRFTETRDLFFSREDAERAGDELAGDTAWQNPTITERTETQTTYRDPSDDDWRVVVVPMVVR